MLQIKEDTAKIWEYKIDNNANIANFVHLWKTRKKVRTTPAIYQNYF